MFEVVEHTGTSAQFHSLILVPVDSRKLASTRTLAMPWLEPVILFSKTKSNLAGYVDPASDILCNENISFN